MRLARYLHLAAIGAFIVAVVALILGESLVSAILFMLAAVGFGASLIVYRRR